MEGDDARLLRVLQAEHSAALWRYVVHLTGSSAEADDIVQETMVKAWRRPKVLDQSQRSARAWLFTVARNLVIDSRRSAHHVHEVAMAELPEREASDRVDERLDAWLIADALTGLSADHRAVIVHAYYLGRSTAEMAAELGIAEGTVKSRLHYGLRALRLALQEKGVVR
jgi:RNA polymerase sigma-70 factor (ECF subfamily)